MSFFLQVKNVLLFLCLLSQIYSLEINEIKNLLNQNSCGSSLNQNSQDCNNISNDKSTCCFYTLYNNSKFNYSIIPDKNKIEGIKDILVNESLKVLGTGCAKIESKVSGYFQFYDTLVFECNITNQPVYVPESLKKNNLCGVLNPSNTYECYKYGGENCCFYKYKEKKGCFNMRGNISQEIYVECPVYNLDFNKESGSDGDKHSSIKGANLFSRIGKPSQISKCEEMSNEYNSACKRSIKIGDTNYEMCIFLGQKLEKEEFNKSSGGVKFGDETIDCSGNFILK